MTDKRVVRASDAERDRVAGELAEHAAVGRIELDELDERLARVYAAKTRQQLEAVTRDRPAGRTGNAPAAKRRRLRGRSPIDAEFRVELDLDLSREEVYDWALASLAPSMNADGFQLEVSERPHHLRFVERRTPHWAPLVAFSTAGIRLLAFLIRVENPVSVSLLDSPRDGTRMIVFGKAPGWIRERFAQLRSG